MSIRYIKKGKSSLEKNIEEEKVSETVQNILKEIEVSGDKAVRNLSQKFDNYDPKEFKLSDRDIKEIISKVSEKDMEDIKFAQSQIVNFAKNVLCQIKNLTQLLR